MALQVRLRAVHLRLQHVNGLCEVLVRFNAELVNPVHGLEHAIERPIKRLNSNTRLHGLLLRAHRILRQHVRRAVDQVIRGLVDRVNLVKHQLLVLQRLSRNHGGAQCRHRGGLSTVHTLDELAVVRVDDAHGQVALDRHSDLRLNVLTALTHSKQQVLFQDPRLLCLPFRLQAFDLAHNLLVDLLQKTRGALQFVQVLPQLATLHGEFRVVALQLLLASVQGPQHRIQLLLVRLKAVEVLLDRVKPGHPPQGLLRKRLVRRRQIVHHGAQFQQRTRHLLLALATFRFCVAQGLLHEPAGRLRGGLERLARHVPNRNDLRLELLAVRVQSRHGVQPFFGTLAQLSGNRLVKWLQHGKRFVVFNFFNGWFSYGCWSWFWWLQSHDGPFGWVWVGARYQ